MTKAYHPDMSKILEQGALNYSALLRLLGDANSRQALTWGMGVEGALSLEVLGEFKYTTSLMVNIEPSKTQLWQKAYSMQVQMYHDAKLAEVISAGELGRLRAIYEYPNTDMLQPDEKAQCNLFLGECVSQCLHQKTDTDDTE